MSVKGVSVAVVIPCYRVRNQILDVLNRIGPEVDHVIVVDDRCPEGSGEHARSAGLPRVRVLFNEENLGVGGTVMRGYEEAVRLGADVIVKLDGDGQMDPRLVPGLIQPIVDGKADYTKGNRFYFFEGLAEMPFVRLFGNTCLSFINKLVSGYWDVMDPTNGFTAIHGKVVSLLPLEKVSKRYFFESDMLFRLSTIRAVVRDVPMASHYAGEKSSLRVWKVLLEFPGKYCSRFLKRVIYNYYLRDFNFGSLTLLIAIVLLAWGGGYGIYHLVQNWGSNQPAPSGVVTMAALPIILGFQSLLTFFQQDIAAVPRDPLQGQNISSTGE